jgi:hypothetical protein
MEEQSGLEVWMPTDELKDAVFSLRIVSQFLDRAESDPLYWKWIVIILHNALQSLMVSILHDRHKVGSSRGKTNQKVLQKWKDLRDFTKRDKILSEKLEDVRMADVIELYENLKSHRVDGVTLSEPFEPSEEQEKTVRDLHFWRNYFVHFRPGIRLLSTWEYLSLMPSCIAFAELLTQTHGLVGSRYFGEAKESVAILKRQIEALRQKYLEKFPKLAESEKASSTADLKSSD